MEQLLLLSNLHDVGIEEKPRVISEAGVQNQADPEQHFSEVARGRMERAMSYHLGADSSRMIGFRE